MPTQIAPTLAVADVAPPSSCTRVHSMRTCYGVDPFGHIWLIGKFLGL